MQGGGTSLVRSPWDWAGGNQAKKVYLVTVSQTARFAVCIANEGYEASLERNKIYAVVEDCDATADGDIRIVDESGEDYLYPSTWFVMIEVPQAVQDSVIRATA